MTPGNSSMRSTMAALALTLGLATASAQAVILSVNGTDNIFGAGHVGADAVPQPGGGGGGTVAPSFSFAAGPNQVIRFSTVTGSVSCCFPDASTFNGPDGNGHASGNTDITSFNGIAGMLHDNKTMFLVGVFTSDTEPSDPAPTRLHFSDAGGGGTRATSFFDIFVELDQPFFIGDGLTGTGSGSQQTFHVPNGATHLYLGFADAFAFGNPTSAPGFYDDNVGSLRVVFDLSTVPEPGTLALLGLGVLGMGAMRRRARA